ncbi:MAG: 3-hydroxyisobutyrate dehydrogenase [Gammaproteobacteria bacterium]|nr:3-hydroxyisobutyrate dehydrogenase [Gammaproteobacteria bacterium]
MAHVGFIGLGHMGLPMAKRLLKAGHQVIGFDLEPAPLSALNAVGGGIADSLHAVVLEQDVVITMLQTGSQVKAVCCGEAGIFQAMSKGTLFIDCSTIDVESTRFVHLAAEEAGLLMVEAPVSGGVAGAVDARLTFMVGGSETSFQKAEPILSCMGKTVVHAGSSGSGVAAKICNNMILGVSMAAVSEAFLLAEKLGLSAKKLHEISSQASGNCWVMDTYVPVPDVLPDVPANRYYQAGFTSAMMLKDLCLAGDAAEETGVKAGMAASARALYDEAFETIGDLDFSAIIQFIQSQGIK